MQLRDHTFLGMTQSLCPECLGLTPAKIIAREGRVYFRKHCPTHGVREDFVCSDVSLFDQMEFNVPGKVPTRFGVETESRLPVRLRIVHGARTAHVHRPRGSHDFVQSRVPDVLRSERPARETLAAGGGQAGDRSACRGRGPTRGLTALRRRTDDPSAIRPDSRLCLQPADRHCDDQHERPADRPRFQIHPPAGPLQASHSSLSPVRRVSRIDVAEIARRVVAPKQSSARSSFWASTALRRSL